MKKLLIACSMVGACALVACAEAVLTPQDWFGVTTSLTNGGTLAVSGDALCEVITADSKFEIDSDFDNPVVFTAATHFAQSVAKVSFNLDAAVVPYGALQSFDDSETAPKVAFALYQNEAGTETNFTAWVGGSAWIQLSGATVPDEGNPYALIMEFDNQTTDANKVRFSIGQESTTNVLTGAGADTDKWFSYASRVTGAVAVNFVGCGKVASFLGQQFIVGGEIIVIPGGGKIEINNEAQAAFKEAIRETSYSSVEDFLKAAAKEAFTGTSFKDGMTVAEAYALGLVEKDSSGKMAAKDNGVLKVSADAQASVTDGIPVNLNIVPPADSGATVTYQLQGSSDGATYVNVGESTTDKTRIKILTSNIGGTGESKYRFFKVVTTVTLKDAPTPNPDSQD